MGAVWSKCRVKPARKKRSESDQRNVIALAGVIDTEKNVEVLEPGVTKWYQDFGARMYNVSLCPLHSYGDSRSVDSRSVVGPKYSGWMSCMRLSQRRESLSRHINEELGGAQQTFSFFNIDYGFYQLFGDQDYHLIHRLEITNDALEATLKDELGRALGPVARNLGNIVFAYVGTVSIFDGSKQTLHTRDLSPGNIFSFRMTLQLVSDCDCTITPVSVTPV